jgi:UDP-N-acetylglucosamine 2-epimerase (non-hydrolysing)
MRVQPRSKRVIVVVGTRPEAIKMAPLVIALRGSEAFEPVVVATGQHRAILDQALELFDISPEFDLHVMTTRQTLSDVTARILSAMDGAMDAVRPDAVVVQGDTTTSMAAALSAFYRQVPVIHLEAGLRTGNRHSPFPEEINRRMITQLASQHLAPTADARQNLLAEGVDPSTVVVTGNTVIDALRLTLAYKQPYGIEALENLDDDSRRVLLVTVHRRESWGPPLASIARALAHLAMAEPDVLIVVPVHPNPVVREILKPALQRLANVALIEPLSYGAFVRLMARASVIITDSGGLQEEGPALGKPVLVMRDFTERPEAVAAGAAWLVGTEPRTIIRAAQTLLHDDEMYGRMATAGNPFGDGNAAVRCLQALENLLGLGPPPADFSGLEHAIDVAIQARARTRL